MDLAPLKAERTRRPHRPWPRSQFTRISSIVRAYGLGEDFLRTMDGPPESVSGDPLYFKKVKDKQSLEMPLFALATLEEYYLVTGIIRKINNPYLDYVQDPEEIRLCRPLFRRNPHLGPDELARFHFATLLGRELARPKDARGG